jgi:hypothetical protein
MKRLPRSARGLVVGTLACVAFFGGATRADAFEIEETPFTTRWPFDKITYYVSPSAEFEPSVRALRAWDSARTGWRFVRVSSKTEDSADILIQHNFRPRPGVCIGAAVRGYAHGQTTVLLYGQRCRSPRILELATAHEIGHVLGLAEEETRCAVMNPRIVGEGSLTRPALCSPHTAGELIRADDRRGAQALHRRAYTNPRRLCSPSDERPIFAHEGRCRYAFDCLGIQGENLLDIDGDGLSDPAAVDRQVFDRCRRTLKVDRQDGGALGGALSPRGRANAFAGTTSQGLDASFVTRRAGLENLTVRIRFACGEGSRPFDRRDPLGREPLNMEVLGPFPRIPLGRRGFRLSYQSPSNTASYAVRGSPVGDGWRISLRVIEGWSRVEVTLPDGTRRGVFEPDPDGAFLCETGRVTLDARPHVRAEP